MTGSVDDLDEKLVRAIRSHAFYFIQKPFDREVLKTLVERCLELRWRREEHRRHLKRLETEMGPSVDEGDQLLLYTDGVSDVLAGPDGCAKARFAETIERASAGGASLLDAILADVQHDLAGRPRPDDLTLLTAKVLGQA
jgi:DNA-binding NtrC family response regulator